MARSPIQTSEGPLAFLTPTLEIVEHLARTWPMGMTPLPPGSPAPFGIVFQRGESEVSGVKIQQVDYEEKDARGWMEINRIGLGRALGEYMKNGYSGILIACPYLKKRGEKYEPGMAFFAAPDPDGKECREPPGLDLVDQRLGKGSSAMILAMAAARARTGAEAKIPTDVAIDFAIRTRLELGAIDLGFMTCGGTVFCLKRNIDERDPVWELLVQGGVKEVVELPSIPIATPGPGAVAAATPS